MVTGGGRRLALRGLSIAVVLLSAAGVVAQYTTSPDLGHSLIGGAVLGSIALVALGRRHGTT
ncbi:hypothetical protein [Trebonia sp.]|uniref:hypothetical protein n=1 Tax=Trebonia sp. TaxID=2767075 RepID=UPI002614577E|nr:hypothetical protein [Trebonia sp.]